ncbi:MAG: hypothetical protein ACR2GY_01065 [Phycisphaerales bacterium]
MVYTYDDLHRLAEAERGVDPRTCGPFTHAPGSEQWTLDMLGNWNTLDTDTNGDGDYLYTGESEDRTHNDVNELTQVGGTNGDLTYDHSGNLREQETREENGTGAFSCLSLLYAEDREDTRRAWIGYHVLNRGVGRNAALSAGRSEPPLGPRLPTSTSPSRLVLNRGGD